MSARPCPLRSRGRSSALIGPLTAALKTLAPGEYILAQKALALLPTGVRFAQATTALVQRHLCSRPISAGGTRYSHLDPSLRHSLTYCISLLRATSFFAKSYIFLPSLIEVKFSCPPPRPPGAMANAAEASARTRELWQTEADGDDGGGGEWSGEDHGLEEEGAARPTRLAVKTSLVPNAGDGLFLKVWAVFARAKVAAGHGGFLLRSVTCEHLPASRRIVECRCLLPERALFCCRPALACGLACLHG